MSPVPGFPFPPSPSAPDDLWAATRFRRPLRDPVEAFDIPHPALPPSLDGLTILHISDLHVRHFHAARARFVKLLAALDDTEPDLVAFTGDFMDGPGHKRATLDTLAAMHTVLHPRLGSFGVFGNHDSPDLQRALAQECPTTHWFGPDTPPRVELVHNSAPFHILGLSWPEDPLTAVLSPTPPSPSHPLTPSPSHAFPLTLAHYPAAIIPAAALGLPLLFSGHTHAGQVRVSSRLAPHTSSDIPPHLATGVLRLRSTLMCISRGIGEGVIENLRVNCPWQAPLYTLRRGPLPEVPRGGSEQTVTQVMAW